jgi:predicted ArsR family transcriptional regulator
MKKASKEDKILAELRNGPSRGLTAADVVTRTGFKKSTVRAYIYRLVVTGRAYPDATLARTGKRGRPSYRYKA